MTNAIPLTIVGNLTADPEYRTYENREYASFTVASSERIYNAQDRTWGDGPPTYMPCNLGGALVQGMRDNHVVKGRRVIVQGKLVTRWWDDRETGKKRSRMEMRLESIGLVPLPIRDGRPSGGQSMRPGTTGEQPWSPQGGGQQDSGWSSPDAGWSPGDEETPF